MKPVVLITGIAGGIGQATAELFAQQGWLVTGIDRQADPKCPYIDHYQQADCGDPKALAAAFDNLVGETQNLHSLINNVALQICQPILETSLDDWDQVMAVNLRAAFLLAKMSHPYLQQTHGSIVNTSSVHALATSANIASYAASKGGLIALTRAMAIEWAADQIRVNALLPGAVNTPMLREGLSRGHLVEQSPQHQLQELGSKTVMGRVGQPSEIAQAIAFLADNEQSSFMTGQTITIDGGAIARLSTE